MNILHAPKTGFRGAYNDAVAELKKQNLPKEEFNKKGVELKREYEEQMCSKYADQTPNHMQQQFMITGKDVMDNRHYMGCGHAVKAFCYVNSTLPPAEDIHCRV